MGLGPCQSRDDNLRHTPFLPLAQPALSPPSHAFEISRGGYEMEGLLKRNLQYVMVCGHGGR